MPRFATYVMPMGWTTSTPKPDLVRTGSKPESSRHATGRHPKEALAQLSEIRRSGYGSNVQVIRAGTCRAVRTRLLDTFF
jgi:hypothetical protein